MATHVTDYKKTSKEIVFDLINADNNSSITETLVALGEPVVVSGKKTSLKLSGVPQNGSKGSVVVNYNRVMLTDVPELGGAKANGGGNKGCCFLKLTLTTILTHTTPFLAT